MFLCMCLCLPLYKHCSVLCAYACLRDIQFTDLFLSACVFAVYVIVTVSSLLATVGQGT